MKLIFNNIEAIGKMISTYYVVHKLTVTTAKDHVEEKRKLDQSGTVATIKYVLTG